MTPLGYQGEFVFCRPQIPGDHAGRIFRIWSRWLVAHREKSLEEFNSSDCRHIPIIHQVELQGFQGRQEFDFGGRRARRVPDLDEMARNMDREMGNNN